MGLDPMFLALERPQSGMELTMPRASRHYLPRYIWHLTRRCHRRPFLLRFAKNRQAGVCWLYAATPARTAISRCSPFTPRCASCLGGGSGSSHRGWAADGLGEAGQ
jgi:hypothetical protein